MGVFLAVGALLIAAGFLPAPLFPKGWATGSLWVDILAGTIVFSPLVPILAVLIRCAMGATFNRVSLSVLAAVAGVIFAVLSVLNAALSGAGAGLALVHGISLTVVVAGSILLLSAGSAPRKIGLFALIFPVVVAIWSLGSAVAVAFQADKIANGRAFCLAPHRAHSDVVSFAQLRGLSFYSTSTGYKSTSRWYFHGILLVENANDLEAYNWSPRRLAFQRIERPERLIVSPLNVCTPKSDFLGKLLIW